MTHLTCEDLLPNRILNMGNTETFNHIENQLNVFEPFRALYEKVAHLVHVNSRKDGQRTLWYCSSLEHNLKKTGARDEYVSVRNCVLEVELSCSSKESRQSLQIDMNQVEEAPGWAGQILSSIKAIGWNSKEELEAPLSAEPFKVRVRVIEENDSTQNMKSFSCQHDGEKISCKNMVFIERSLKSDIETKRLVT